MEFGIPAHSSMDDDQTCHLKLAQHYRHLHFDPRNDPHPVTLCFLSRSHISEIRMLQGLVGAHTPPRVVIHQLLQQIYAIVADLCSSVTDRGPGLGWPTRKAGLEVWQLCEARPDILRWCAKLLKDPEYCVNLGVTSKEGSSRRHLCDYTTDAPHIHWQTVYMASEQDLGGAVPDCHDFVSVLAKGHPKWSCQPKVCDLQAQSLVDQEVLRFEITMQNPACMAKFDSAQKLPRKFLDHRRA
mmetsp:Transcript_34817/g.81239  ORF Transcript_34817/g.81239 Transcript_34817/m.81239 type:complete len:241 (-) Transcript_34817:420-1142(-)